MPKNLVYFFLLLVKFNFVHGEYYSETNQDRYVNETFFKDTKDGFYVDIGAHAGVIHSNTYYFEKLGWNGICFEPDPRTFKELKKNRNCILYNCAVGSREGTEKFIQHPTSWVSGLNRTYCDEHRECWKVPKGVAEKYFIDVKVLELNKVLKEHQIDTIDFLSIDTEGAEKDILLSIDYDQVFIKVMTIENKYEDDEIPAFLLSKGFIKFTKLHRDDIYVNTKWR